MQPVTARHMNRRRFLQAAACAPLAGLGGCMLGPSPQRLRITLAGQALMTHSLCADPYPGLDAVIAELATGHVVFTDLEAAIETPRSGAPTRDTGFLHTAPPAVLDCLRGMGFNLLALANNHAWDLGTEGVLATREAVAHAGFAFAGSGANLAEAGAAGFTRSPRVALVAMAAGRIRDGAAATATRPGVNELRFSDGLPHGGDVERNLAAIAGARGRAARVIAYLHNHEWGEDMTTTAPWVRHLARRCIDAGADMFVSHGAPLLHGIEFHGGKPLLHGLGSLVFHSRTAPGHYPAETWESAIVHCDFGSAGDLQVSVVPVVLNELGDDAARHEATRGRPRIARGEDRARILQRLAALSAAFGTAVRFDASTALATPG